MFLTFSLYEERVKQGCQLMFTTLQRSLSLLSAQRRQSQQRVHHERPRVEDDGENVTATICELSLWLPDAAADPRVQNHPITNGLTPVISWFNKPVVKTDPSLAIDGANFVTWWTTVAEALKDQPFDLSFNLH